MVQNEQMLRQKLCLIARRMYRQGFSPCNSGNISVKLGEDRFLITPSGVCKDELTEDMLVLIDERGNALDGKGRASSECRVHLYCYTHRPDVMAVCHAHAPFSVAYASVDRNLDRYFLPDQVYYLGAVPRCEYRLAGTQAIAESMAPYIAQHSALLLGNHGAVTMGNDLDDAWGRMEMLEQLCKVSFITDLLGGAREFTQSELQAQLDEITAEGIIHPGAVKL